MTLDLVDRILRSLHHPVNENSRGDYRLRVDSPGFVNPVHFGDADPSRHGHDRVPVPLGAPVDQITKGVGFLSPQQGKIGS